MCSVRTDFDRCSEPNSKPIKYSFHNELDKIIFNSMKRPKKTFKGVGVGLRRFAYAS